MQSFKSRFYTFGIVLAFGILPALLSGCGPKKVDVPFPPSYNPKIDRGVIVAAMPEGTTLLDAVVLLNCGKVQCDVLDLHRVFYITVNKKDILLQDSKMFTDLPAQLDCSKRFICQIDSTAKVTIAKRK